MPSLIVSHVSGKSNFRARRRNLFLTRRQVHNAHISTSASWKECDWIGVPRHWARPGFSLSLSPGCLICAVPVSTQEHISTFNNHGCITKQTWQQESPGLGFTSGLARWADRTLHSLRFCQTVSVTPGSPASPVQSHRATGAAVGNGRGGFTDGEDNRKGTGWSGERCQSHFATWTPGDSPVRRVHHSTEMCVLKRGVVRLAFHWRSKLLFRTHQHSRRLLSSKALASRCLSKLTSLFVGVFYVFDVFFILRYLFSFRVLSGLHPLRSRGKSPDNLLLFLFTLTLSVLCSY